ncbi:MAG: hypothetical protein KDC09_10095 [Bacteroidales bacterium]|nr:hypothetical protein [Bacteroidales bacterium]
MRSDDDYKIPEGDFIPGIYNYCDSWCERCLYTSRCMNFAMGQSIEKEIEKGKRIERSMEENKEFWQQIDQTMNEAAELIDEEFQIKEVWQENTFEEDDDDDNEAMEEFEAIRKKAEEHEMSAVSQKYMMLTHKWLKEMKNDLVQDYDEETDQFSCSYPGLTDEELKQLTEAVELVRWFHTLISVKIRRAITSQIEEENDGDMFEGFPKDSEGSAMVALKGVNASISGWTFLYKVIKPEAKTIKSFLHMLWWLKTNLENKFPGALTFVWPPEEK